MKKLLIKIAVFVLLITLILCLCLWIAKLRSENKRLGTNYAAEVSKDYSAQQTITTKELKQYFKEEVSQLQEYDVKAKNIENIIKIQYKVMDSLHVRDTLLFIYDTIKHYSIANFDLTTKCNHIKGTISQSQIEITEIETTDTILIALYKEKRTCLFQPRKVRAIALSQCKRDTLAVLRNLKVQ
jgi:hypothetical protein